MSESKYPPPLTSAWWDLRNAVVREVVSKQRQAGSKWTIAQVAKSKRDEYVALHGREAAADEDFITHAHWSDRA